MNGLIHPIHNAIHHSSGIYSREGVLIFHARMQEHPPFDASFLTQEGVFPVTSWVGEQFMADPHKIDKVHATLLSMPDALHVLAAERDEALDPIGLVPEALCPAPGMVTGVYELVESISTPELRRLVSDAFTLNAIFHGFWISTAGSRHHAWPGGLAWHSLEVAQEVLQVVNSNAAALRFTNVEKDLGVVGSLLHDVGKIVSYNDLGYRNERALVIGHELLGLDLLREPLDALRKYNMELGDALSALLLSRTAFSGGRHRLEAIREVVSKADRKSARLNSGPRQCGLDAQACGAAS